MKRELRKLKKEIENIEITYDYEDVYCKLINATIDYQNETQDWCFEYVFDEYIDDYLLQEMIEYQLKQYGIWAVRNLLDGIEEENGIYRIDAYGYGHSIDRDDLDTIKTEILDIIEDKLKDKENED